MAVNGILFSMFVMVVIAIIIASIYFSPDIPVTNQEPEEVVEEVDAQMACPEEGELVSPDELYDIAKIIDPYRFDISPAGVKPKRVRCMYSCLFSNSEKHVHFDDNADLMESMEDLKNRLIENGQGLVHVVRNNEYSFQIKGLGCVLDDGDARLDEATLYRL